ncbi:MULTISPECIES: ABC transporter permease [unclassified Halanaerobium]|uniref:ABC transporter permease n=1 Tax=unclassified Halanaerobium TaxID=2641197 RepID=UPI000DF48E9D|nr:MULTISPECIES: ABC transporter permease [unclassified Halanaerobium]RCW48776.1 peptide/nickel transport system permease protein [Halanaerobium sp. MA284_MarDTE_T2]RCW89118.1 peptide/nickel transport system permease protein [Halanaerobium sp. DL-01]
MFAYFIRRTLGVIPVILGVILVVFILTTIVPGDPARIMMGQRGDPETLKLIRKEMGLDEPTHVQLVKFYKDVFTLNLGRSYRNNMTVIESIKSRLPVTATLAIGAMIIAVVLGVSIGIYSATHQYTWQDYLSMIFSLLGIASPVYFVGLIMVIIFARKLGWVPGTGLGNGEWIYYVLPILTLGVRPMALIVRLTRSTMLEVVHQDYVKTARAKGLKEKAVIYKHALKNALIPVITIIGLQTASLLSGVMLTETIYSLPGLGRLSIQAVTNRDFPIIRGVVLFMALVFVLANLLVDLSYGFFDPRIRYE